MPTRASPHRSPSLSSTFALLQGFCEGLWDGVVLCKLLNTLHPGVVRRALRADDPTLPKTSPDKFLHAHNYKEFISACERLGVPDRHLFLLHDLGGITGDQGKVLGCLAVVKERHESAAANAARRAKPPPAPSVSSRAPRPPSSLR